MNDLQTTENIQTTEKQVKRTRKNNKQNKVLFELCKRIYITPSVYNLVMQVINSTFEEVKQKHHSLKGLNIFSSFDLLQCYLLKLSKYGEQPIDCNQLYEKIAETLPAPIPHESKVEKKRLFINHYSHDFMQILLSNLEKIIMESQVEKKHFSRAKVELSDFLFRGSVNAVLTGKLSEQDIFEYLQRKADFQKECLSEKVLQNSNFILKPTHLLKK